MALNAVIAEFLNVDVDRVRPGSRLVADLGMSPIAKKRLRREIAFIFDGAEFDIPSGMKVEELVREVANIEFARTDLVAAGSRTYNTGAAPGLVMVAG